MGFSSGEDENNGKQKQPPSNTMVNRQMPKPNGMFGMPTFKPSFNYRNCICVANSYLAVVLHLNYAPICIPHCMSFIIENSSVIY